MQKDIVTNIYFIRHGRTMANINNIIQGRIDNPLSDLGKTDAKLLAELLKKTNLHFDIIISSPLSRAIDTKEIVKKELIKNGQMANDIKTIIEPLFIEREFGEAEGKDITEENYNKITNELWNNLESKKDLCSRTKKGLDQILNNYSGMNILVVCHSHVIKSIFTQFDNNVKFTTRFGHHSLNRLTFTNKMLSVCKFNNKEEDL